MKNKTINTILLVLGATLTLLALFVFDDVFPKEYSGVLIGLGSGLFGLCIANLAFIHSYAKNPGLEKQDEIEFKDERNTAIRNKAKAKSADIIQFTLFGLSFVTIIIKESLWITLIIIGIALLKTVFELILMNKYQKQM